MTRVIELTELTKTASDDYLLIEDVSDTTMAPTGTTKRTLASNLASDLARLDNRWVEAEEPWSYLAINQFDPDGLFYPVGTKIRYKQGGDYKYGVIVRSSSGGRNIIGLSNDFILTNNPITDAAWNYGGSRFGLYPRWFEWTPGTTTGWGTAPQVRIRYSVEAGQVIMQIDTAAATSDLNRVTFTSPISAPVAGTPIGIAEITDNGARVAAPGMVGFNLNGTTGVIETIEIFKDFTRTANWTATGSKQVHTACISFNLERLT